MSRNDSDEVAKVPRKTPRLRAVALSVQFQSYHANMGSVARFLLTGKARLGAGLAAAAATAGATVALCESDARGPLFDPEALERGAKALKEINASPYAKKVFDLTKQQEVTKQQELKTKEAEQLALQQQYAKEVERVRWEEQRKSMQQDAQTKAEMSKYDDQLARARAADEHEKYRQRNAELVRMQEDSAARQEQQKQVVAQQIEAERRATDTHKAELEKGIQRERALAEAEGRIKENRENEDVNRRAMLARLEEERKKAIESIEATFRNLGEGVTALLTNKQKLTAAVAGFSLLALGVYGSREGTRVAGRAIDRYLGTPKLVRETSRRGLFGRSKVASGGEKTSDAVKRDFSDIVLPRGLHDHVRALAAVTANTRSHGAPFRHMLFYGPPGTGKSMAAKRLARTAGMDYAIMSGGDVAPLGSGAVSQLHELFDWSERSRRGLLLFVDEADAFLGKRGDTMSEGLRGALNAMLFRTGDQSRDFAVVLATNRPADLDPAVLDRMDEALEFPLPGKEERREILELYLDSYIARAGTSEGGAGADSGQSGWLRRLLTGRKQSTDRIRVDPRVDESLVQEAAALTAGFSGRELAKMMASMQAAVYGSPGAVLTPTMFRKVLDMKLHEHQQRRAFLEGHQSGLQRTDESSQ